MQKNGGNETRAARIHSENFCFSNLLPTFVIGFSNPKFKIRGWARKFGFEFENSRLAFSNAEADFSEATSNFRVWARKTGVWSQKLVFSSFRVFEVKPEFSGMKQIKSS